MPLKEPTGAGWKRKVKLPHPHARKAKKARKGRRSHAKHPRATTAHTKAFHERAMTPVGAEHPSTAGEPFSGAGSTASASPRPAVELTGLNAASAEGLSGAILDLVGEGKLTVARALTAWTREQDRLANRAWRRPGGLQRMAGL